MPENQYYLTNPQEKKMKNKWRFFKVALIVSIISLLLPLMASAEKYPGWNYDKDNPAPKWFDWGKDYWPTEPVRGGTYRTAAFKYIGLLNPHHWPVNDFVTMSYIYERPMWADGTHKPNAMWMAESWKYTGSTSAIVKIRKGIQFHDGSDFNAAGLKYMIEWMTDKRNGAWSISLYGPVKKMEVIDEYTLGFEFKRPWANFPGTLQFTAIVSPAALKKDVAYANMGKLEKKLKTLKKKLGKAEKKGQAKKIKKLSKQVVKAEKQIAQTKERLKGFTPIDKMAVGSNQFMVEEGRPGNYLLLKRNPNWWFGKSIGRPEMPYFDKWKVTVIPDASIHLANLRANKLDTIAVDPSQYRIVKNDPKLNVRVNPVNSMHGLRFNHKRKVFQDIRVRKAISHAIDRKALIHGVHLGLGREASAMYPGDHWGHNPDLQPVKYDPELSKKLLAEAGYADGLTLTGLYWNYPISLSEATAMKSMLKKVGVDWQVEHVELAAFTDKSRNLEYDLAALSLNWIWDPDVAATALYHSDGAFNNGRFSNKEVEKLIVDGRSELDIVKRQKIYHQIEEIIYKNYYDVWTRWSVSVEASRKNVYGHNQELDLLGKEGFWYSHPLWFKDGKP